MILGIIDYQAGNITSLYYAVRYWGEYVKILRNARECMDCDRIIFPGVGEAKSVMMVLAQLHFDEALQRFVEAQRPLLGVCIGAHVVLSSSEEGNTACLNLVPGQVRLLPVKKGAKVPHMGWNNLSRPSDSFLFSSVPEEAAMYFAHSYYPEVTDKVNILSYTEHSVLFPSSYVFESVVGVQFHPEKSGMYGLYVIRNFLYWSP